MITPDIFQLAEALQHDRLAAAAQARRGAEHAAPARPLDQLRLALGARLIAWGQQLQPAAAPVAKAR